MMSSVQDISNGEQTPEQVRNLLVAARKLIEKPENWYGGSHPRGERPESECFCTQTAISHVSNDVEVQHEAFKAIKRVIGLPVTKFGSDIWPWNDNEIRTHAEVLAAFDKAIASLSNSDDRVQAGDSGGVA